MSVVLVVDASMAIKWLVEEDEIEAAPALLRIEAANVRRNLVARKAATPDDALGLLALLRTAPVMLVDHHDAPETRAPELALSLGRPVNDCLALAERTRSSHSGRLVPEGAAVDRSCRAGGRTEGGGGVRGVGTGHHGLRPGVLSGGSVRPEALTAPGRGQGRRRQDAWSGFEHPAKRLGIGTDRLSRPFPRNNGSQSPAPGRAPETPQAVLRGAPLRQDR